MDGIAVPSPQYTAGRDPSTEDYIGVVIIDGNKTCGELDLKCTVYNQTTYTARLTLQGLSRCASYTANLELLYSNILIKLMA